MNHCHYFVSVLCGKLILKLLETVGAFFLVSDTVNREPVVNLSICCLRVFLAHLVKGQASFLCCFMSVITF